MATLSMSGGDPIKKKKKDSGVADCTDGKCGPTTRGKMSLSKFNPTKKRYSVGTVKKERDEKVEKPSGGLHQNMRDLGGNPGDTRIYTKNSSTGTTDADVAKGRLFNLETRKQKKNLRMSK